MKELISTSVDLVKTKSLNKEPGVNAPGFLLQWDTIPMTDLMADEELIVTGREECDKCSARAMVMVILPYGDLTFCMHHYNDHALALTEEGGIAKLLGISQDQIGIQHARWTK